MLAGFILHLAHWSFQVAHHFCFKQSKWAVQFKRTAKTMLKLRGTPAASGTCTWAWPPIFLWYPLIILGLGNSDKVGLEEIIQLMGSQIVQLPSLFLSGVARSSAPHSCTHLETTLWRWNNTVWSHITHETLSIQRLAHRKVDWTWLDKSVRWQSVTGDKQFYQNDTKYVYSSTCHSRTVGISSLTVTG